MSMTHKLIDVTSSSADVTSDTVYPQRHGDESGSYQVSVSAGTAVKVQIFGRLGSNHAWHEVAKAENTTATAVADITIYPQMYVFLDADSTSSTTVVSIME
jgi:hypothetical protein